jgi:hypothetical protein
MRRWRIGRSWVLLGVAIAVSGCVGLASALPVSPPPSLSSVASLQCPSPTLCLGIGVGGPNLVTSRAPGSGARGWVARSIDGGRRLRLLTCASVRWCLAVDNQDRVLISTDPARGAASWGLAPGGPGRHLDNVGDLSCPSVRLCVGVAGHYVISSVRPQRGGTAWRQALVNQGAPTFAVDCSTATRCVAAGSGNDGDDGRVLTSTDPTERVAWKSTVLEHGSGVAGSASVSCASAAQCVVAFGGGHVFSTTNLTSAAPRWDQALLGPSRLPDPLPLRLTVSCTAGDVCAAAGDDGSVWASPAPGRSGHRRWRRVAVDTGITPRQGGLTSIACVGRLCVAADGDGHVLSTNAITRAGAWRRQIIGQPEPTD